jgi:hypothetical protein
MMMKKWMILFFVSSFMLCSCDNHSGLPVSNEIADYFFPADSLEPYIFAFRNNENPLDEKFYRLINTSEGNEQVFIIERYNSSLRITEGFTLDVSDGFTILDHMVVDAGALKRKSNVSSSGYFPKEMSLTSRFVGDFPYLSDSLVMIYDSKKYVYNSDTTVHVLGKKISAIHLKDTVRTRLADPLTKEVLEGTTVIDYLFAYKFGLVYWGSEDRSTYYELVNVFSDSWWMDVAQAPQVRM